MQIDTLESARRETTTDGKQLPQPRKNLSNVFPTIVIKRFKKDELFGGAEKFIQRLVTQLAKKPNRLQSMAQRLTSKGFPIHGLDSQAP